MPSTCTQEYARRSVQERLTEKNLPFVSRVDNPPVAPQARPIKVVWTVLERKIYEDNWEAKNIDHSVKRFMMSLRLIARWGQPLYGLVPFTCVGLAPGRAHPVRCVLTSS